MSIFNIPLNYSFLPSLYEFILKNLKLSPIELQNLTILLPSRRSCNELRRIFVENSKKGAMILPKIKAVGDIDYENIMLSKLSFDNLNKFSATARPTSDIKYKILLMREILNWSKNESFYFSNINLAQTANLARELEGFLNEMKQNDIDFTKLKELSEEIDERYSIHWNKIANFLQNFGERWNNYLKDNEIVSIYSNRLDMLNLNNDILQKSKPQDHIIIAGINGSVSAAANLVKTLIQYNKTILILNGFEKNYSNEEWENINEFSPHFILKKFTTFLEINRKDIQNIEFSNCKNANDDIIEISRLFSLPANQTYKWYDEKKELSLNNVSKVICEDREEEKNVISFIALNSQNKKMAIISNNEIFARQLEIKLKEYNIPVNNSYGNKLSQAPVAIFMFLILDCIAENFSTTSLLSLLKNPFTLFGCEKDTLKEMTLLFEDNILRGKENINGFDSFYRNLEKVKDIGLREKLESFLLRIQNCFKELNALEKGDELENIVLCHIKTTEKIANSNIWQDKDYSRDLNNFLNELCDVSKHYGFIKFRDYIPMLDYFISQNSYSSNYSIGNSIGIMSNMESRLLNYDLVIISGVNDGEFPKAIKSDPWLSKGMRSYMGMPQKEQSIGNEHFSFLQHISQKECIVIRSEKEDKAPSFKSRFFEKLEVFLSCQGLEIPESKLWKEAVRQFYEVKDRISIQRPNPIPDIKDRPRELFVTYIEKLMSNPYDVYASKILELKKKEDIDAKKSFANFGSAIHSMFEDFVNNYDNIVNKKKEILKYGEKYLNEYFIDKKSQGLWYGRLEKIALRFVEMEEEIRNSGYSVFTEKKGFYYIEELDFTVRAKCDRIQISKDGDVRVIDYKTGNPPAAQDVKNGKKSQLTVASLILKHGGFEDIENQEKCKLENIEYWQTTGRDGKEIIKKPMIDNKQNPEDLIEEARVGVFELIFYFSKKENGYIATAVDMAGQKSYSDYTHLNRVKEWLYN